MRIGTDELFIKTETGYTTNGNYVATQTDARGNSITNAVYANGKVDWYGKVLVGSDKLYVCLGLDMVRTALEIAFPVVGG